MLIGIPLETVAGETRVAFTPETVKKLKAQGHTIRVQSGAGIAASAEKNPEIRFIVHGPEPELRRLIHKYSATYGVPEALVHRVVIRESRHRPTARNGQYMGLMQISPATARGMGYRGPAEGLLDAETNLKYGVKYLRGAYMVADGDFNDSVKWYSKGYYYEAKRKGLLKATGLR